MRRAIQITIPALLIGLGVYLLVGCIPIPGNFQTRHGMRPDKQIGSPDSEKPLKVGSATYEHVKRLLGVPWSESRDHLRLVYRFDVNDLSTLWTFCFLVERHFETRWLLLQFSSDGRLQSFKTYKEWKTMEHDVPDVRFDVSQQPPAAEVLTSSPLTRPSTSP